MNKSKYCGITGDELANMLCKSSKYSKKEAEELTPLEALDKLYDYALGKGTYSYGVCYNIIETALKDYVKLQKEYEFLSEHYRELLAEYNKKVEEEDECFGCPAFGKTYRAGESPCHVCPAGRKLK